MRIEATHPYPCSVPDLLPLFCSPEALHQRHQRLGFRELEVRHCSFDGTKGKVEIRRSVPAAGSVPRAIRQFHQEWNRISQREEWYLDATGVAHCTYSIRLPGMPVTLDGSMRLDPSTDGCVNRVNLEIQCGIPILGRVAVSYLAEDSQAKLEQEYRVLLELLRT